MGERRLNFDAPLLSVRRISKKPESSDESEKKKKKRMMIMQSSNQIRRNSLPVGNPYMSFDHLTESASVPFVWEQIPGTRKDNCNYNSEISRETRNEDEDDEVYSDALDTLSRTDSFSSNCSVGGVSGFENRVLEGSGKLSTDVPESSRDFMMSRFLPAAKAMALNQQSQCSPKKQQRQNKEMVVFEPKPLVNPIPNYDDNCGDGGGGGDGGGDDGGDDDGDDDVSTKMAKKGCGFLPRLCVKNSMCILNPVPGLKTKGGNIGKPGKTLNQKSWGNRFTTNPTYEEHTGFGVQSPRLSGSNRFTTGSIEQLTLTWSSRRLSGFLSPYRFSSSRSPFRDARYFGAPEKPPSFQVNRLSMVRNGISKSQELYPRRPWETVVEKTVFVDTQSVIQTKNRANSNLGTPSRTGTAEKTDHMKNYCSFQEMKEVNSTRGGGSDDLILDRECKSLGRIKIGSEKTDVGSDISSPVPPPLPKTPSESWLWRTRTLATPRNSVSDRFANSRFNTNNPETSKILSNSTKWETMVKTSFSHQDHVRYSEELIIHKSKN